MPCCFTNQAGLASAGDTQDSTLGTLIHSPVASTVANWYQYKLVSHVHSMPGKALACNAHQGSVRSAHP